MTFSIARDDLRPYRPGTDGPWNEETASHLVRRAAFGSPPAAVRGALDAGPEAAAATLLGACEDTDDLRLLSGVTRRLDDIGAVQAWWLYRMLHSPAPALEKLALFWHGHFATSQRKVDRARLMMRQIELFHRLGPGPFDDLLLAVARDPAMVVWLDGNSNRRGEPNENFARELMELFSLGIGNYTEKDIQEAARAFTGWHERESEFWFNARAHDDGVKRIFGREGAFGGDDTVRLCAESPACARFIARKLCRFYVHPEPAPETVELLAELYTSCGRDARRFLTALWSSRAFYRREARRALVSSPVEFAVGSIASLGARVNARELARAIALMGQDLLRPPSVKGWDGGSAWINSTTLLARYRFSAEVGEEGELDIEAPWSEIEALGAAGVIRRFFPEGLDPEVEGDLLRAADGDVRLAVVGALELPEYQFI
jgi:uncharacterized protein (DUF1800 family)